MIVQSISDRYINNDQLPTPTMIKNTIWAMEWMVVKAPKFFQTNSTLTNSINLFLFEWLKWMDLALIGARVC